MPPHCIILFHIKYRFCLLEPHPVSISALSRLFRAEVDSGTMSEITPLLKALLFCTSLVLASADTAFVPLHRKNSKLDPVASRSASNVVCARPFP